MHVGIELPPNPDENMQKKINETIVEMSHHLGINTIPGLGNRDKKKATRHIQNEISKNSEWDNYEYIGIQDPQTLQEHPGFKATRIMLGKTTFADESYSELQSQLEAVDSELVHSQAFKGIALHYFKVLNEKFNEDRPASASAATKGDRRGNKRSHNRGSSRK